MSDLIIEGAKGIPDGLYVIKDGEMFKYKPNGGTVYTVRSYHVTDRPHGEWEIFTQGWHSIRRCSNCKWTQTYSDPKYMGYEYNFCPNCGADMREMKGEPK